MIARDGCHAGRAGRRLVIGWLVRLEIRLIEADPAAFLAVPPDELLSLRPRPAIRSGTGAVVQDPTIVRPSETPFGFERMIAALPITRAIAVRLGEDTAVDPAAARR